MRISAGDRRMTDIRHVCAAVLANHSFSPNPSLVELLTLDRWARAEVHRFES